MFNVTYCCNPLGLFTGAAPVAFKHIAVVTAMACTAHHSCLLVCIIANGKMHYDNIPDYVSLVGVTWHYCTHMFSEAAQSCGLRSYEYECAHYANTTIATCVIFSTVGPFGAPTAVSTSSSLL